MSESSAFGPDIAGGNLIQLNIFQLISHLKRKSISHFLFLPAAPHILLQYHATSTILPSIAKGSISAISLLQKCHPYQLFKLYNQCYKMTTPLLQSLAKQKLSDLCHKFFNIRPTKKILFKFYIQLNDILPCTKLKQFYFLFLKPSQSLKTLSCSFNPKLESHFKVTLKSPLYSVII